MKQSVFRLMTVMFLGCLYHATAQSFVLTSTNTVGASPLWVTAADVNGDGQLDLISANVGSAPNHIGTLSVLTNNGSGVFGSNASLNVGSFPSLVTAVDVNGDGKVDLISANSGTNTLTVLTNNGSGSFGSNATYIVGGAQSVTAADINGDGKVDLISANNGFFSNGVFIVGNTLTVLTNNGSGIFGFNATLSVERGAFSVVVTDVNGDGRLDLISANYGSNTVSVLTNSGSGVFGSNATLNVGHAPYSITLADINGDGKMDLITPNQNGGTLSVLTNNGSGIFGSNATYTVGNGPVSVVAADFKGNGKVDLICANEFASTLSVLTNDGSGGFNLVSAIRPGNSPACIMAADVNGDGKLDLICANAGDETLSLLLNTSTFPLPTSTPPVAINFQSHGMLVSWPSASAGWSLQQNPDLATTHWGPSGYSGYNISDDGTNKSLTIPSQPGNLFFRLLHP